MKNNSYILSSSTAAVVAALLSLSAAPSHAVTIDGIISTGEWAGATTIDIGGGGTAYFRADPNFVYAAYDITGWTAVMGAASQGNLLGFGVWKLNNGFATSDGVEFQQSTTAAAWGNDGNSGTLNGLVSAFRINAQTPPAASIPLSLLASDSFAPGHRVWELKVPINTLGLGVGDTIWVIGGINYNGQVHWYGGGSAPSGFPDNYSPMMVTNANSVVPEPSSWAMLFPALNGVGFVAYRRKNKPALMNV